MMEDIPNSICDQNQGDTNKEWKITEPKEECRGSIKLQRHTDQASLNIGFQWQPGKFKDAPEGYKCCVDIDCKRIDGNSSSRGWIVSSSTVADSQHFENLKGNDSIQPGIGRHAPNNVKALVTTHSSRPEMTDNGVQCKSEGTVGRIENVWKHEKEQVEVEWTPAYFYVASNGEENENAVKGDTAKDDGPSNPHGMESVIGWSCYQFVPACAVCIDIRLSKRR